MSFLFSLRCLTFCIFTVSREPNDVTHDNGDVLRDCLFTGDDVTSHHHHQQNQQQHQRVVYCRQRDEQQGKPTDSQVSQVVGVDSLSDVLLTRIFYSGLRSDDLCRCAVVCRRWNRLVWNPLLWTCIDLSQTRDCDADLALRSALW